MAAHLTYALNVRVSSGLASSLREAALRHHLTVSAYLRQIVVGHLQQTPAGDHPRGDRGATARLKKAAKDVEAKYDISTPNVTTGQ